MRIEELVKPLIIKLKAPKFRHLVHGHTLDKIRGSLFDFGEMCLFKGEDYNKKPTVNELGSSHEELENFTL